MSRSRRAGLKGFGIAIAAACLSAAPAAADPPAPRRFDIIAPSNAPHDEVVRAEQALRRLLTCLVRLAPARARALVDSEPGSAAENRISGGIHYLTRRCNRPDAPRQRIFTYATLSRGMIAEIFYHQAFPQGIEGLGPADPGKAAIWASPRAGAITRYIEPLHATARCVVLRNPAGVDAVLRTEPMTAEERSALRSIRADISACLDATQTFTTNAQSLRSLLAEAALKYGEAQRSGLLAAQAPSSPPR